MYTIKTKSPLQPHLDEPMSYALTGFARVDHLVNLYEDFRAKLKKSKGRTFPHVTDILRSAVVFCHANLEQIMREYMLHEADWSDEFLSEIPLVNSDYPRAKKITLADLVPYADKGVDDLLIESVEKYLEKKSFTSVDDLIFVVKSCHLNVEDYKKHFPLLAEMIQRRHHIVHTADVEVKSGKGRQMTKTLSVKKVRDWNKASMEFSMGIAEDLLHREIEGKH